MRSTIAPRLAEWPLEHVETLYRQAHALFGQQRYPDALAAFRTLCLYAPSVRHAQGMTACLLHLGDGHASPAVDTALLAYALSTAYVDPSSVASDEAA